MESNDILRITKRQDLDVLKNTTCIANKKVIVDLKPEEIFKSSDFRNILENPFVEHFNYSGDGPYKTIDEILYIKHKLIRCPVGKTGAVIIPEGTEEIMNYAFSGCNISSVKFPESLREVKDYAFSFCRSLEHVDFGNGITNGKISNMMFYRCAKLKEVTIPSQITYIGEYAFAGCGLNKVNLPEGIKKISDGAFFGCQHLKEIELPGSLFEAEHDNAMTDIGLSNINKITVPKLTDEVLRTGIIQDVFDTSDYCKIELVEIVTPNDTFYLSKYATKAQLLSLTSDKVQSPDFLDYEYSFTTYAGDYATVKRYLYLVQNGRTVSPKVKERIKENWKNIIQLLLNKNDQKTIVDLMETDIATADNIEYVWQVADDIALKAYALKALAKKTKKGFLNV